MLKRLIAWLFLLGILLPAIPASAADVVLGGKTVFRIDGQAEAQALSKRIEGLLQNGAAASAIRVEKKDKGAAIYWGSELIITVTPELARSNNSEALPLARRWADNMYDVASIGLLNVDCSRVVLSIEGEKLINTSGLAEGDLIVKEPQGIVSVTVYDDGSILLHAQRLGKTQVTISKGKGVQTVWVHVKDWAGRIPKQLEAEVTGHPALDVHVQQAVLLAVATNTFVNPGCSVEFDTDGFLPRDVPAGATMRFAVPMTIAAGEDYLPVRGTAYVDVRNVAVEWQEQNLLLVSNRPERVDQDGVLLNYTFSKNEPTRLMYSHLNDSAKPRNFWVNLSNPGSTPVKLLVNWTYAGPGKSEIHVGQTSAKRFLQSLAAQSGCIVTLRPGMVMELADHTVHNKMLVTGFAMMQILEGDAVNVEVRNVLAPSENDARPLPDIGAPFNPFKIHPHGVFAQPYFEMEAEYTYGKDPVVIRYGESPWLIDFETGLPNTGNFGVLYKAIIELKNPDNRTRQAGLYFKPLNGPGGANFLIDGRLFQAPFRKVQNECLVTRIELSPRSNHLIEVITLPEASSCYPAQFEIRALTP
ncbi:hypothetical protein IJT17_01355 [bacterium]|nr:hypothetical protein [bacterium]